MRDIETKESELTENLERTCQKQQNHSLIRFSFGFASNGRYVCVVFGEAVFSLLIFACTVHIYLCVFHFDGAKTRLNEYLESDAALKWQNRYVFVVACVQNLSTTLIAHPFRVLMFMFTNHRLFRTFAVSHIVRCLILFNTEQQRRQRYSKKSVTHFKRNQNIYMYKSIFRAKKKFRLIVWRSLVRIK